MVVHLGADRNPNHLQNPFKTLHVNQKLLTAFSKLPRHSQNNLTSKPGVAQCIYYRNSITLQISNNPIFTAKFQSTTRNQRRPHQPLKMANGRLQALSSHLYGLQNRLLWKEPQLQDCYLEHPMNQRLASSCTSTGRQIVSIDRS